MKKWDIIRGERRKHELWVEGFREQQRLKKSWLKPFYTYFVLKKIMQVFEKQREIAFLERERIVAACKIQKNFRLFVSRRNYTAEIMAARDTLTLSQLF